MVQSSSERCLLIRSRLAEGFVFSESGVKALQHVLTDWFPRAIYADLTDDTASVDLEVRKDFTSGKNVFSVSFKKADGNVIKKTDYRVEMLTGKRCAYYDQSKSRYAGKKDGFDHRLVYYSTG